MPGTVVKQTRRGGAQGLTESRFAMPSESKTNILPSPEHHDAAQKERCVFQRYVSRLPPTNASRDGSQPFRIIFPSQCRFHTNRMPPEPNRLGIDGEF